MKNVVNYILSAKKKIFLLAFLAVFSSFYTMVLGAGEYSWNNSTKTLTINKAGALESGIMPNYNELSVDNKTPWTSYLSTVQKIILADGITYIGKHAFYGASYLADITIPISVKEFNDNAFNSSCTKVAHIRYTGTPSEWASITFGGQHGHPFGSSTAVTRNFYFYGSGSATTELVFTPNITKIKPYAFYKANSINSIHIPGTVDEIGDYALYCNLTATASLAFIAINRNTPPTTYTHSISFNNKVNYTRIYVPEGSSGYNTNPWYNGTSSIENAPGAQYIGRRGDVDRCASKGYDFSETGYVYPVSGHVKYETYDFEWSLSEAGVLTLNGEGAIPAYIDGYGTSETTAPWYRFRNMVYKIVVKGDITELNNTIQRAQVVQDIDINQEKIPTASSTLPSLIYGGNISVKVKPESLTDATVTKLGAAPWNSAKLDIQLSDDLVIDQASGENKTILTNCSTYVEKPVNVQLTRSTLSSSIYNTFCSPASMTEEEIVETFGDWYDEETGIGTELVEYTGTSEEDDAISLNFSSATSIEAGKPYLFRPANDVPNIRFTNVNPTSIATEEGIVEDSNDKIDFYGILEPKAITEEEVEDQSVIFLTGTIVDGNQQLTWANGGTLKGMRAYWKVKEGESSKIIARRPVLRINYQAEGENTATGVEDVQSDNVQCTKVLQNGQIYLIYEGQMYDVQGKRIH